MFLVFRNHHGGESEVILPREQVEWLIGALRAQMAGDDQAEA